MLFLADQEEEEEDEEEKGFIVGDTRFFLFCFSGDSKFFITHRHKP